MQNLLKVFLQRFQKILFSFSHHQENEQDPSPLRPLQIVVEIGLILVLITLYCSNILNLDPVNILPGRETFTFQLIDRIIETSLKQHGTFPFWNPYILTGLPIIGDPMLHIYNPLFSIPLLLLGTINGLKIAIYLHFLLAGIGMWYLAGRFHLSTPARIWSALVFTFAGAPAARFLQAEYLFTAGYAWLPLMLAFIIQAIQTRRKLYVGLSALSLFFLFVTGDFYYPFLTLFVLFILCLFFLVDFHEKEFKFNLKALIIISWIGIISVGLISIQLYPDIELHQRLGHNSAEIGYSQSIQQIFTSLTSTSIDRQDTILSRGETYAYIGSIPLLALVGVISALVTSQKKRLILFLLALLVFTLFGMDFTGKPFESIFLLVWPFSQFRYQIHILAYTTLAVVLLAGVSFDSLLGFLRGITVEKYKFALVLKRAQQVLLAGTIIFMSAAVFDLFSTNKQYIGTLSFNQDEKRQIAKWLKQNDSSISYVSAPADWYFPLVENDLHYYGGLYPLRDIRNFAGAINTRMVSAGATYQIIKMASTDSLPENTTLVKAFPDYSIVKASNVLPFAFEIPTASLTSFQNTGPIAPSEVNALIAFARDMNSIEVVADGKQGDILTVLSTLYSGWKLEVDGKPQAILNVNGFMAAEMAPGPHRYSFTYYPSSFNRDIFLTLFFLAIVILLIYQDRPKFDWQYEIQSFRETEWAVIRQRVRQIGWINKFPKIREMLLTRNDLIIKKGVDSTTAVFSNEGFKPVTNLDLQEQTPARLQIYPTSTEEHSISATLAIWIKSSQELFNWLGRLAKRTITLEAVLFTISISVYWYAMFTKLDVFPPYFFSDEAHITEYAETLIKNHFIDANGLGIPIYVEASGNRWTPLSVLYAHAVSLLVLGKSITATRTTSAFVGLIGVIVISLTLKQFFKVRLWWAAPLVMAGMPAWFIHARTGFETAMTTAFYGFFLLCYLLYRYKSPWYIYAALFWGAVGFYSYSNAQAIFGFTAVLLVITDFKYHIENRKVLFGALVFAVVLALPLLIFCMKVPQGVTDHMRAVGSYMFSDAPVYQKALNYLKEFTFGISPQYWFIPEDFALFQKMNSILDLSAIPTGFMQWLFPANRDFIRHFIPGESHIPLWILPFYTLGLVIALRRIKEPVYRIGLILILAAPAGGAVANVTITRVLVLVVPVTIFALVGINWLIEKINTPRLNKYFSSAFLIILCLLNMRLYTKALTDWPIWNVDYGLYGLQYGAKQIFVDTIPQLLTENPKTNIKLSTIWANAPEQYIPFFLPPENQSKVVLTSVASYLNSVQKIENNDVIIFTKPEYDEIISSGKFKPPIILKVINYPNGSPGFYVLKMEYSANAADVIAAEELERSKPVTNAIDIEGETWKVTYSRIDIGELKNIFDGNMDTLIRGASANPFILDITFPTPRPITGFIADLSSFDYLANFSLYGPGSELPVSYSVEQHNVNHNAHVVINFDKPPATVQRVHIEITNLLLLNSPANIHIRDVYFSP